MSLINKFTIGFNNKERRKSLHLKNNTTIKVKEKHEEQQKQALSQELTEILITFGFDLKQIMTAFKEYKFTNIDEACHRLMKDNETGKYNHRFIPTEKNNENSKYQNINSNNICVICKGDPTEHGEFYVESKTINLQIQNKHANKFKKCNTSIDRKNFNFNNDKSKDDYKNNNDYNSNAKLKQIDINNAKENKGDDSNFNNIDNVDLSCNVLVNNQDRSIDKFSNFNADHKSNNIANSNSTDNLENKIKKLNQDMQNDLDFKNNKQMISDERDNEMDSNRKEEKTIKIANVKINIPPETLNLFEDPDVCRICFAEKMTGNNKAEFACGHIFCRKCVTNYLTNCIMEGKVLMIKCLYGGCPKTFVEGEIKMFIGDQLYYKYKKFKISQIKLNNPDKNYINCPIPDCEEIVELEENINEEPFVMCNFVHKFCARCKTPGWHKKGRCNDYVSQVLKQIQQDNKDSDNYKQCPRCSVIIEKNEGCNQMKCINCNLEFCWLCMKRYADDHYALYNFRGCPGMRFNTDGKRKMWNNPFLKTLWLFLSCILGVFAVFSIIIFFAFFGCAYEFAKCYIEKINKTETDEDEESNYEENIEQEAENQVNKPLTTWNKVIIVLMIMLGIGCQPVYLLIYLLYALMECYRRFNCWFYYID